MKLSNKLKLALSVSYVGILFFLLSDLAFANVSDPGAKVNEAVTKIQVVLQLLIGGIGICSGTWIILKKMPALDDPHTKNEMFKGVGLVLGAVFIASALVWIVPWVMNIGK